MKIYLLSNEKMKTDVLNKLNELYLEFMEQLSIDKTTGILGKISNNRYLGGSLRFSGMPYIGSKYSEAKLKILFVGLDIGIDECREANSFHNFDSRRECVAGSIEGCTTLGYNNHISGTYGMALSILKDYYNWENEWNEFSKDKNAIFTSSIRKFSGVLPIDVLDYVSLTNIHKFVSTCRGCNLEKENPICKTDLCLQPKINRTGNDNRRWYNEKEEIDFFLQEIQAINPDILYFQGSHRPIYNQLKTLNLKFEIWLADHPSAWNVGANKIKYIESNRLSKNPIGTM